MGIRITTYSRALHAPEFWEAGTMARRSRRRVVAVLTLLGMGLGGAAWGQTATDALPRFKEGIATPPAEAVAGAPFDAARLFEAPPLDQNAAPRVLEALLEFGPELAETCLPEGPERTAAVQRLSERKQRADALFRAYTTDPKTVAADAIDAVLAEHADGFRKLIDAQKQRPRCVFQTGLGFTATLSHLQAARQVARLSSLKVHRELQKGEINAAINDVGVILRLARDLQPRGFLISQLVAIAITNVTCVEMVQPILAAPGLTAPQCDRLTALFKTHEAGWIDAYRVSLEMEYISIRITILDLIHRRDLVAKRIGLKPGASLVRSMVVMTAAGPDAKSPFPDDADAQLARTTPAELDRAIQRLNRYDSDLLKLADLPAVERVKRLPDVKTVFAGDDVLTVLFREFQPSVDNLVLALARGEATRHGVEGLVALRRWQLTHAGRSPVDLLDACRESGLANIPLDPYDGQPLRLALVDGRPVIYAVGKDGHDDHGQLDSDHERKAGDILFRLAVAADK